MKIINGFKIYKELGKKNGKRYVRAICKLCGKLFDIKSVNLYHRKGCGCYKYNQLKPLSKIINGFKIIEDLGTCRINHSRYAIVECRVCKNKYKVNIPKLKKRNSCGCLRGELMDYSLAKSYPRLIRIYRGMKFRCYNKHSKDYERYGEKGIIICNEWLENANNFFKWALTNGYEDNLTIDRIYSKGNYEPKNCQWITMKDQVRKREYCKLNMELAKQLRKDSNSMTYKEMKKKYNISYSTIANVIYNRIWNKK